MLWDYVGKSNFKTHFYTWIELGLHCNCFTCAWISQIFPHLFHTANPQELSSSYKCYFCYYRISGSDQASSIQKPVFCLFFFFFLSFQELPHASWRIVLLEFLGHDNFTLSDLENIAATADKIQHPLMEEHQAQPPNQPSWACTEFNFANGLSAKALTVFTKYSVH